MRLWGRRARRASTNEDRLKRLYVLGKLTLDAFMEQVDAQLEAGTLDDPVPQPYLDGIRRSAIRPEYAAEKWRAGVSAAATSWSTPRARDTLTGSRMSRAAKMKCRTCGTSSNVGYAPYPGTIPEAATGGRFICGDCLYAEENPGAKRIDRPLTGKAKAKPAGGDEE